MTQASTSASIRPRAKTTRATIFSVVGERLATQESRLLEALPSGTWGLTAGEILEYSK